MSQFKQQSSDATPWGDYQSAASFTFDLDAGQLWRAGEKQKEGFGRFEFRGEYGPTVAVPRILEVFDKHDCHCTFFVPGRVAEEWPETITQIHDHGHEIAHHTYSHVHPRTLSREQEQTEFLRTVELFEDLTGEPPLGYRGGQTDQTLELAEEVGMIYDSSMMDTDIPYLRDDHPLVELPNHFLLDDFVYWGFNMKPTFDFQSGISPVGPVFDTWEAEFEGLHRRGRMFMLTMHPQVIGRASRIDALDDLLETVTNTDGAWVATCAELARHWKEHGAN
ncbi:polysaccharide deacetylase [Haloferax mucosum ATCC BAA-1512]|uniref:Polysaccharide deacetylase n=1 Tax=Haloferax mucosum ATCC BAA-1512 TaxID=662479 RepID=M0ISK3_9EURY|nr:polysaccharide deacetylase [Haloferax mucosum]ELZ98798.1 polysaccharide deacetylase [Haloferax mucosum ATCC BAA-1512]